MTDHETIRAVYIRICRDSKFGLPFDQAAALCAGVCGIHPIEVWCAFPYLDIMKEIAAGTHPVVQDDDENPMCDDCSTPIGREGCLCPPLTR